MQATIMLMMLKHLYPLRPCFFDTIVDMIPKIKWIGINETKRNSAV